MSARQSSQLRVAPAGEVPAFELQQVVRGTRHALVLTGELDLASAPMLGTAVAHIRMDRSTQLVLDLRKLSFIDSTGIRAVLVTRELCAERGCEFSLIPGPPRVRRVFEVCGLLDRLPFRNDVGAVASETSEAAPAEGVTSGRFAERLPHALREPLSGDDS
jgi:anti-sigma B factor antagonist